MDDLLCFRCGKSGHRRADCDQGTRRQPTAPPDPADAVPARIRKTIDGDPVCASPGLEPRRPAEQIADSHAWANRIRLTDKKHFGGYATCGDPADVYDSPARRAMGIAPVHRCVLRQMAAAQLQEETTR
jgi:hypothetical protein